jgi:hypothetical protein
MKNETCRLHNPFPLLFTLFNEDLCLCLLCIFPRYTANEGPVRIQYKCQVSIYEFPLMKLFFPKQNHNVLSPCSYRDLYISRIGLPILLQGNMWTDPENI